MSSQGTQDAKSQDAFTVFRLSDGTLRKIQRRHILAFAVEALEGVQPLSSGAQCLLDATAVSVQGGRLTELLLMCSDDEDTEFH
jgi:hypothetical protein